MSVIQITPFESHESKRNELTFQIQTNLSEGEKIGLGKSSSNLFRYRKSEKTKRIDVRNFTQVISIDPDKMVCETEGMITFEDLVAVTSHYGFLPPVVPELKSITLGGAVSGIGVESSSFRYGFVHETVLEMDILLSDGTVVTATPKNKYKDLFFAIPNSYGVFGYILRLKIQLIKMPPFVKLTHLHYSDPKKYFADLGKYCSQNKNPKKGEIAYIDGSIFSPNEMYITLGEFTDEAPYVSNYKYMQIYYRSIQKKDTDYLTSVDYIWRWDPDWFWCSQKFFVQIPWVRLLTGWFMLRSTVYWKILMFFRKTGILDKLDEILKPDWTFESVVQDVEIPLENCVKYMEFFHKEVGIKPVWVCPVQAYNAKAKWDLYTTDPKKVYVNFGFWDVVGIDHKVEDGYINKKIEAVVDKLKGKKSLYSTSYYSRKKFDQLYNAKRLAELKKKYDPESRLRGLYEKVVERS